ncbi:MAG: hypothetical protein ABGY24_05075 [bacterium]
MVDVEDLGEDVLPEDVLAALARRGRRQEYGNDDGEGDAGEDEEDRRAIHRRIVSRQLRALAKPSNTRKRFGEGRVVASGIVVKSLKSTLGKERARDVAASRKFLESRLERHDRSRRSVFVPSSWR